jgi:hypothetical protein
VTLLDQSALRFVPLHYEGREYLYTHPHLRPNLNTDVWTLRSVHKEQYYTNRVLATVKNSALNAVFPITLRNNFPIWVSQKIVIEIQCC